MVVSTTQGYIPDPLRILIVEDSPGERELLREQICGESSHFFTPQVWDASDLATALDTLGRRSIDVILLDLALPDSTGLETLFRVRDHCSEVAIVVLTGMENESLGVEAIQHHAQDYLLKGRLDGFALGRSMRYAVERQRLRNELEQLRFQQRQRQEMRQLEHYSDGGTAKNNRIFSLSPSYGALVRQYVFATREGNNRPSLLVQSLAQRLAAMGAGAQDVVRLHIKMLKETGNWTTSAEERAFGVDARLALVELLGTLADLYREASSLTRGNP